MDLVNIEDLPLTKIESLLSKEDREEIRTIVNGFREPIKDSETLVDFLIRKKGVINTIDDLQTFIESQTPETTARARLEKAEKLLVSLKKSRTHASEVFSGGCQEIPFQYIDNLIMRTKVQIAILNWERDHTDKVHPIQQHTNDVVEMCSQYGIEASKSEGARLMKIMAWLLPDGTDAAHKVEQAQKHITSKKNAKRG